jgi:restriction endonuclease S subunit
MSRSATKTATAPDLRFPAFSDVWDLGTLAEKADKIASGKTKPEKNGEFPVYGSIEEIGRCSAFTHDEETLLIARVGANAGTINRVSGKYSVTDNTLIFSPKKGENLAFIEYFLKSFDLKRLVFGTGQPLITGGLLKSIKTIFPTLPEQRKVADFLTAVDGRIGQLIQKKALLEDYKKGVMQQLFTQAIRFKDDHGNDFPDWVEKDLKELASPVKTKNRDMAVELVLTNSAIQGIISQREYFDKDIANAKNIGGYYVVSRDDFVYNPRISETAPVGPIKRNHLTTGVMSPLYTVFRFDQGDATFFEFYFQTNEWHVYMNSVANFGARHDRMAIKTGDFYCLPMPFPSLAEQTKIADFLSAIDRKIESVATQITETQTFKRGLLQQMFV